MRRLFRILSLVTIAILALGPSAAQADLYIPAIHGITQEQPGQGEAHVRIAWCKPELSGSLDGYTISIWDGDQLLGSGVTTARGDAIFEFQTAPVVEVRFEGGKYVEEQSFKLEAQDGPLFVGVWMKSRYFIQCYGMASNWQRARR